MNSKTARASARIAGPDLDSQPFQETETAVTHIFQHPAVTPEPNVGSAMAALLPQVPDALRAQMEQAYSDDLVFMFTTGMNAGEKVARDAIAKAQGRKPGAVSPRPKLRLVLGGVR